MKIGIERTAGFTLTELLVVVTLIILLLSMAAPAVIDWGRMARMRSATSAVVSSVGRARSQATALAEPVHWTATNITERGVWAYAIHAGPQRELLGTTNALSKGIWLDPEGDFEVPFNPDGTVAIRDHQIVLCEHDRGGKGLISTITVYRVTGQTRVMAP